MHAPGSVGTEIAGARRSHEFAPTYGPAARVRRSDRVPARCRRTAETPPDESRGADAKWSQPVAAAMPPESLPPPILRRTHVPRVSADPTIVRHDRISELPARHRRGPLDRPGFRSC